MIGSHLDSVPHGGNYDGAAGVVAGLTALARLRRLGRTPRQDITVMAIRANAAVMDAQLRSTLHQIAAEQQIDAPDIASGAGAISIREAARRVNRDVRAVHSDVTALINAGGSSAPGKASSFPIRRCMWISCSRRRRPNQKPCRINRCQALVLSLGAGRSATRIQLKPLVQADLALLIAARINYPPAAT